ncbi:clostripain [Clostridium perfringens]|uniref:clostripain n=1 Tax=Clostridium perfringens TaxID=1502 RepID=UPI001A1F4A16|nr:clostripain [Clostridium perfringens]MBO3326920.1 clostripain [Clostridium perfringens]HAT4356392.1 clostripain [Clostridium perfringens]
MFSKKKFALIASIAIVTFSMVNFKTVKATENSGIDTKKNKIESVETTNNDKKLTIMMYADCDNNLEESILGDIEEIKRGYTNNPNLNVILLVDRIPGYSNDSSILGSNFTDTRLYKISENSTERISGKTQFPEITTNSNYEANMGDPNTLQKFIKFCKENYKADKYMLIMSNHGGGAKDENDSETINKSICWDESNKNDCLYTAEISDALTKKESVDILAFDACLMGTAEVAYQYRPGNGKFEANSIVASAPTVWGNGFAYDEIFSRLKDKEGDNGEIDSTLGGKEKFFNPSTVTNKELGALFIEEQRDSTNYYGVTNQQLSFYDLSKIKNVKTSLDALARNLSVNNEKTLIENLRGHKSNVSLLHYFKDSSEKDWIEYPYFDLYDLCEKISLNNSFSKTTQKLAKNVMKNVDNLILYSFGGSEFKNFKEGKNGISIFLPDGNRKYYDSYSGYLIPHWAIQRWYNSIDTNAYGLRSGYGKLSWCKDGINPEINKVGNWFELLDSWFDKDNYSNGGYNHYQY